MCVRYLCQQRREFGVLDDLVGHQHTVRAIRRQTVGECPVEQQFVVLEANPQVQIVERTAVAEQVLYVRVFLQSKQMSGKGVGGVAGRELFEKGGNDVHGRVQLGRSTQLVGNHQTPCIGTLDDVPHFDDFIHEGRMRHMDVVVVAGASEYLVVGREGERLGRHEQSRLGHHHPDGNALQQRRLAHAVHTVQQPARIARQADVVGNVRVALAGLHQKTFDERVTQGRGFHRRTLSGDDGRSRVAKGGCRRSRGEGHVELRDTFDDRLYGMCVSPVIEVLQ